MKELTVASERYTSYSDKRCFGNFSRVLSVVSEKCGRFYARANTNKERHAIYEEIENSIPASLNGETFDTTSMNLVGFSKEKSSAL